ncbi:GIY-YIG nuclease family protein [Pontibacillus sp. HMF3514]|uniref:GIY-YIG nuclease family protein n=1 Tax=Pontibacillus sp. HMF3514 TaxID=2692425 RepID=UPI00131FE99C|nr:GIY-YIG nuclease family protein [Pontibacillus sp. HMF3514]QHE50613.1 GIY-YIG nuclease family protein [Pontibacillus sp. HMF3514]
MEANHMVYILKCKDGSLYTGYTNDFNRRLRMHEQGKGAKYTRGRGPFEVVYKQAFLTKEEAMQEEYRIKKLNRPYKEQMISSYQEKVDSK